MKPIALTFLALCVGCGAYAQTSGALAYRRNALAMTLVYHPEDEFGAEIYRAFDSLPIPDKYDDHTILNARTIDNSKVYGVQSNASGYYKATYGHQLTPSELRANALYTEQLLNDAVEPDLFLKCHCC